MHTFVFTAGWMLSSIPTGRQFDRCVVLFAMAAHAMSSCTLGTSRTDSSQLDDPQSSSTLLQQRRSHPSPTLIYSRNPSI
ncbi:uncharacterized protein M421DRAFT_291794 [Didymella exigua CBS 183.55]|uniref:Uncharacterized protein n=1 Tax=Didymella exigua CBS 183.55 TaxID=1150837 RepID=A0A6A5RXW1_9PLEO|nr:uncharacterized protein M421DRAFT_291794 [Didymella exigua CBS 183.55]KAF1932433.1 hypothetical protein M421DRAFT_291794 [Didymella exigua CBS 183.55]